MDIFNVIEEDFVNERFELEVLDGNYKGVYDMLKPSKFDQLATILTRNEDTFGVDYFILGDNEELQVFENHDPNIYYLIKNCYEESAGDSQIVFRWFVTDSKGIETSILGNAHQINMNTLEFTMGMDLFKVVFKVNKREEQNKFNNRYETTVDLFSNKNLDDNPITPVSTVDAFFKEPKKEIKQKYFYSVSNAEYLVEPSTGGNFDFPHFMAIYGDDDTNVIPKQSFIGEGINNVYRPSERGILNKAESTYTALVLRIENLSIEVETDVNNPFEYKEFDLNIYLLDANFNLIEKEVILPSKLRELSDKNVTYIDTKELLDKGDCFDLPVPFPVNPTNILRVGCEVREGTLNDKRARIKFSESSNFTLIAKTETLSRQTKGVRLFDALDQITKQYTDSKTVLDSTILSKGGRYYNNLVYSGIGIRGVEEEPSLKLSFDEFFENGVSRLMALGYDMTAERVKLEEMAFFFKDVETADLSEYSFARNGFKFLADDRSKFNTLKTGSKRFSTEQDQDLGNFNTKVELTTPLITRGQTFDMETSSVIDSYKIAELLQDQSTATNEGDDDAIVLDVLEREDYEDTGVIQGVEHSNKDGDLVLEQFGISWTTYEIKEGDTIEILDPINIGTWRVKSVSTTLLTLDGSGRNIETGNRTTTIKLFLGSIIKNRTNEGFLTLTGIEEPTTTSNVGHNPIFQLLRWYGLWGSGLTRKPLEEKILVNDYKNNGEVTVKVNPTDFPYEYPNETTLNADRSQQEIRNGGLRPLFSGDRVEIKIAHIKFSQFFEIYNNWRYGFNKDDSTSFGYISLPNPFDKDKKLKVFPMGDNCFQHKKGFNTLTIRGLVKFEE